jgi:hypothetical protein
MSTESDHNLRSVLHNFVLEALESRKDPVDLRLTLFEDDAYDHEEAIAALLGFSGKDINAEPVFSKAELETLRQQLARQ